MGLDIVDGLVAHRELPGDGLLGNTRRQQGAYLVDIQRGEFGASLACAAGCMALCSAVRDTLATAAKKEVVGTEAGSVIAAVE
jgi:hypothetical protein